MQYKQQSECPIYGNMIESLIKKPLLLIYVQFLLLILIFY